MVSNMIIYLDLVFIINFIIDLLLLLTVNIALKRYSKISRLLLSALFGSVSLIGLFIPLNSFFLSLFKLIMGMCMALIAFGYKNIKYTFYNVLYLFMCIAHVCVWVCVQVPKETRRLNWMLRSQRYRTL